jgi:hypothetical protein
MNCARLSLVITTVVSGALLLNACDRDRPDVRTDNVDLQRRENDRASERMANEARETAERTARDTREATAREAAAREAANREAANRESFQGANGNNRVVQPMATRAEFRAALGEIAQARCAHEGRCNNVGQGRRYQNDQTCRTVISNELARDLNVADCSTGIDRAELRECMNDINTAQCGNPIDTITRLVACRTSDLCREATVGTR